MEVLAVADARSHLSTVHSDGLAGPRELVYLYGGKVDPGACQLLRGLQRQTVKTLLGSSRLPPDDLRRFESILGAVERFLPEECGGSTRQQT